MRRRAGGSSLLNTMILASLVATLAFTAVALSFHQMSMSQRLQNAQEARDLAEAAVAEFLEKFLRSDGKYPQAGDPKSITARFDHSEPNDRGFLSFDHAAAAAQGVGWSTQNMNNPNSVRGWQNRDVPPESVHLLATGRCRGVERSLEVILHVPVYTNAIASEGQIDSPGPLLVAALNDTADMFPSLDANFSKLLPAHVAGNGLGAGAISLDSANAGTTINVTGQARAMGTIQVGSNVQIQGGQTPNADKTEIPPLPFQAFDPDNFGTPNLPNYDASAPPDNLTVQGLVKYHGDMTVQQLRFPTDSSGAIMMVDGNLTVTDGIRGQGALLCTGNLLVTGASSLDSQTVALVAKGDLTLKGDGRTSSYFRGLLYGGQDMVVEDTTLQGVMVNKGTSSNSMHVKNVNLLDDPTSIDFTFTMPFQTGTGTAGMDLRLGPKPTAPHDPYTLQDFYDSATDSFNRTTVTSSHLKFHVNPNQWMDVNDAATYLAGKMNNDSTLAANITNKLRNWGMTPDGNSAVDALTYCQKLMQIATAAAPADKSLNTALEEIQTWYEHHPDPNLQTGHFNFSPSRFLPLKDKLRVVLWKEI